jgi:hypothetical protein
MKEDRTLPRVTDPCDRCAKLETIIERLCSRLDALLEPLDTPKHTHQLITNELIPFCPKRVTGWNRMDLIRWANAVGLEMDQYKITKI